MGRKPVKRESYRADGITVHRILTAIENDLDASQAWKEKVCPLLRAAIGLLLSDEHKGGNSIIPAIPRSEWKKRG